MHIWSLKQRILLINVMVVSLVLLLLSATFVITQRSLLEQYLMSRGSAAVQQLAYLSELTLKQTSNPEDAQQALQQLANLILEERAVRAVSIRSTQAGVDAHAGPMMMDNLKPIALNGPKPSSAHLTEASYRFHASIVAPEVDPLQTIDGGAIKDPDALGDVEIEYANHPLIVRMFEITLIAGVVALVAIISLIALALFTTNKYSRKIGLLMGAIEQSSNGAQDVEVPLSGERDELEEVARKLNRMWRTLRTEKRDAERSVEQSTRDLRETLEALEIQNIELELARKEAVEAASVKAEFLANTSHEIRTPLNGIVGFTNLLMKTAMDGQQRIYATTIHESANGLLRIINDILDFSKIEAGKLVLDYSNINLYDLLEQTVGLLAPMSAAKDLDLNIVYHHDVPETIVADPHRLQQVMTNLIHNAIKFSDAGFVRITVRSVGNEEVEISVADTGIGINQDQQNKLFTSFSQGDRSAKHSEGGTGLGLAIAQRLIEHMGGRIKVSSTAGEGATFYFKLPLGNAATNSVDTDLGTTTVCLYAAHNDESLEQLLLRWNVKIQTANSLAELSQLSQSDSREPAATLLLSLVAEDFKDSAKLSALKDLATNNHCIFLCSSAVSEQALKHLHGEKSIVICMPLNRGELLSALQLTEYPGSRIRSRETKSTNGSDTRALVVDDNEANLKLLHIMLQQQGIEALAVQSGTEAIACCDHESFSIIFMDIQMPEVSGLEATQIIRTQSRYNKSTPIVAVTAHADTEERRTMSSTGMNDYLAKPVLENQLHALLEKWDQNTWVDKETSTRHAIEFDMSGNPPVDLRACIEVCGNRTDIAHDMLSGLLEQLPQVSKGIKDSRENGESQTYLELVHTLHGHACYTGVPGLRSLCQKIESALKSGSLDKAYALGEKLDAEILRLLEWQEEHDLKALFEG